MRSPAGRENDGVERGPANSFLELLQDLGLPDAINDLLVGLSPSAKVLDGKQVRNAAEAGVLGVESLVDAAEPMRYKKALGCLAPEELDKVFNNGPFCRLDVLGQDDQGMFAQDG